MDSCCLAGQLTSSLFDLIKDCDVDKLVVPCNEAIEVNMIQLDVLIEVDVDGNCGVDVEKFLSFCSKLVGSICPR